MKDDASSGSEHAPAAKRARAKCASEPGRDERATILTMKRSDAEDGEGNVSIHREIDSPFVCENSQSGTNGRPNERSQTASSETCP